MQVRKPKCIKVKMRGRKLRNDVNWYGTLKQKGVKETGVKQDIRVRLGNNPFSCSEDPRFKYRLG